MSGAFYLTSDNADLAKLYEEGREIATYRDTTGLLRLVGLYLKDGDLRRRIARAGHERALRCHTWDQRFLAVRDYLVCGLCARNDKA